MKDTNTELAQLIEKVSPNDISKDLTQLDKPIESGNPLFKNIESKIRTANKTAQQAVAKIVAGKKNSIKMYVLI